MYFGGRMATRRWQIPLRPFVPGLNISPPLTLARPARKNQLEQVFFANSTQDEDQKSVFLCLCCFISTETI